MQRSSMVSHTVHLIQMVLYTNSTESSVFIKDSQLRKRTINYILQARTRVLR